MIDTNNFLFIKSTSYEENLEIIQTIRTVVFQEEQAVPAELEFDGQDSEAQHLLAYYQEKPVATARIRFLDDHIAKIERVAVLPEARNQGIATALMKYALGLLDEKPGVKEVVVHAQAYIQGLYQQLGFIKVGEAFEEAGITHVKMVRK